MSVSVFPYNKNISLLNSGKMYVETLTGGGSALSIFGSMEADSVSAICLPGKINLFGDFVSNIISGNVFESGYSGAVNFTGASVQYIRGRAGKNSSYINFPNIVINNNTNVIDEQADTAAVIIEPNMALSANRIEVAAGRFIIESDTLDATSSQTAHVLVNTVTVDRSKPNRHEKGLVQVNLAVGDHYKNGKLIGFTPPFKKIYADYFFYNFLSRPTPRGLFGDSEMLISNPKTALTGGLGYIVGLGIVDENDPYYITEWDAQWGGARQSDRFTRKLSFAREFAPASFTAFVNNDANISDSFSGESLNTSDVSVTLQQGWNYIGNPFTAPLDMATFIDEAQTLTGNDWGVIRGNAPTDDVQTKYYILSQGQGKYHPTHSYGKFEFSVTYLVAQKVGNTTTLEPGLSSTFVAPMQLFVIKKNTPGSTVMTIPASQRKHGFVRYLRNGASPESLPVNELLIETKDDADGGYDRICVVFRSDAHGTASDRYDASKIFNNSGGVNQIYTMSEDNQCMTTNVVPLTTTSLRLCLNPAAVKQDITLHAYRLATLRDIKKVILEDTHTGIKTDLLINPEYRFSSQPGDNSDRFILHFAETGNGIEPASEQEISIYYADNELVINGLRSEDVGGAVTVVDVKGCALEKFRIDTPQEVRIPLFLRAGSYFIKLAGYKHALTQKILVK
jgi:hypothetical protein